MTALAVLVALVGAMFVSSTTYAADPKIGDVTHNRGFCVLTTADDGATANVDEARYHLATSQANGGDPDGETTGTADITVKASDDTVDTDDSTEGVQGDAGDALDDAPIVCNAANAEQPVRITPNGTATPNVEVLSPSAVLLLGDRDGVVKSGGELSVTAYLQNFVTSDKIRNGSVEVQIDWVRVSGVLDGDELETNATVNFAVDATLRPLNDAATGRAFVSLPAIVIPDGTDDGEYTVTARVIFDRTGEAGDDPDTPDTVETDFDNVVRGSKGDSDEQIIARGTFRVGDPGDSVGSVSLTLGNEKEDNPKTTANEMKAESGTTMAKGGEIWLALAAKNSRGGNPNNAEIKSVIILGTGGKFTIYKAGPLAGGKVVDHMGMTMSGGLTGATVVGDPTGDTNSDQAENPGATMLYVKVEKADGKPGAVEVEATVVGDGSKAESEPLTLTFGGPAKTLDLGDSKPVAAGKMTEFTVTAMDTGGNKASFGQLSFMVKKADGGGVPGATLSVKQGDVGDSTATTLDDDPNAVAAIVTAGAKAPAGVYTIEVSIVGVADSKATTTVIVAGKPANVALSSDPETGDANEQTLIKVTASVTDKNGAPAVDGTLVEFSVLGRGLSAIGAGHAPITTSVQKALNSDDEIVELSVTNGGAQTKDGMVSVNFVATGAGTSVVSATTQGGDASGVLRVTTTDSAVEEDDDAMPQEVASLSCLSNLSGFSAWTCDVEASASQIFGWLESRGATALHLNSAGMWVRYSVVDGILVPGSSDFTVTKSDILYISN